MKRINWATFFQKNDCKIAVKIIRKIYFSTLKGNNRIITYLRDAGAIIGNGVILRDINCLGSEPYLVEIGDNTSFSSGVQIITHDGAVARTYYMGLTDQKYDFFGKVKIGKNCFIGMNTLVLKNVTIGDNCVVGAGSIVTKSIPANSVACGIPAKVIGSVEEYVQKNKAYYDMTVGMNSYEKRLYISKNMDKYEKRRRETEI